MTGADGLLSAIKSASSDGDTALWAAVETVSPLRVVLEHDASGTPREVSANAAGPLRVGDRVRMEMSGRRLTVIASQGVAAGLTATLNASTDAKIAAIPKPKLWAGSAWISAASKAAGIETIFFPAGTFTSTPIAVPGLQDSGLATLRVGISSIGSSWVSVALWNDGASATSALVNVIALQL